MGRREYIVVTQYGLCNSNTIGLDKFIFIKKVPPPNNDATI